MTGGKQRRIHPRRLTAADRKRAGGSFKRAAYGLWGIAAVLLSAGAPAQEEAPPAPATPSPEVTAEWVQARIKEVEQTTGLEDDAKAGLLKIYNDTLAYLRSAEDWAKQAAEYEKARQEAPNLLQEIKAELARPPAEPKPQVTGDESVQQLEQMLAQREAELKAAHDKVAELENERKRRTERKQKAPQEIAAAKQELEQVNKELDAAAAPGESPQVTEAKRKLALARQQALERQIAALELEILSYDARGELLTARIDRAARRVTEHEALVKAWRELVNERRRQEAERAEREAKQARREAARAHPVLRELADANARLAERRTKEGLAAKIEGTRKRLEDVNKLRQEKQQEYDDLAEKLETVGLTNAMALLLRNKLESLPDVQDLQRNVPRREAEMSAVQIALLNARDDRRALQSLEPRLREIMAGLDPSLTESERQEIEAAARELLETRRKLLDSLIADYETYFNTLTDLDNAEKQFAEEVVGYEEFLQERILWVPSTVLPRGADAAVLFEAVRWLTDPRAWGETAAALATAARIHPVQSVMILGVFLLLALSQPRLRRNLRELGEAASKPTTISLSPTLGAVLVTVLLALPWPVLLSFPAWLLAGSLDAPGFSKAVAAGLRTVALLALGVSLLRWVCRPHGLGEAHLGWSERSLRLIRRQLFWVVALGLPCAFVVSAVESEGNEEHRATLGRLALVVGHVVLAYFAHRVLRPGGAVVQDALARNPKGWMRRGRYVIYLVVLAFPLGLAVLSIAGYHYTSLQLAKRLQATLWLSLGLLLFSGVLLRWVTLTRRRLAIEQLRKRRAAAGAAAASQDSPAEAPPEPEVDLTIAGVQTRDLVRSLVAVVLVVGLWFVWVDVLPALGRLNVTLWEAQVLPDETAAVRVANLLAAVVLLVVAVLGAKNLPGLLEIALLQRLGVQADSRYAISAVSQYALAVVGVIVAAAAIHIGWDDVQWLAAAAAVGLGFGLQEIFANFVSGLIILAERPIRVGDIVTVGGTHGKVTRIRMRATTILDWDNRELIVPNKEFITGQLINWTLSEPVTRIVIPVGIAYGSDTEKARDLLLKVARESSYVLEDPAPSAMFREFGDSALNFDLRIYIATRDVWPNVMHEVHTQIDQEFRKAGVEIAFPQRDIHIRSIRQSIPIMERPTAELGARGET